MLDTIGLHEAALRCGVSVATIRRRHREGRLPNTVVGADGWAISVIDLIQDGLKPRSPRAVAQERSTTQRLRDEGPRPSVAAEATVSQQVDALERIIAVQALHIADLRRQLGLHEAQS